MKKYITPLSFISAAILAGACSSDDTLSVKDDSEKTPIEFSMTDNATVKAAVVGNTRSGFNADTKVVMRMAATNGTNTKYTRTSATAENGTNYSTLSFAAGGADTRYWDDAYGRATKLSIYAIAVPDKSTDSKVSSLLTGDNTWSESNTDNTLTWGVTAAQTSDLINAEDLVYSNNIQSSFTTYNQKNGVYKWDFANSKYPDFNGSDFTTLTAGEMQFRLKDEAASDGPGKFDKGNLNFVHALSRVTVKVVLKDGFAGTEDITNVKMLSMPSSGTFDVQQGKFTSTSIGDINMASTTTAKEYMGQVLPGYKFGKSSDTNVLQFEVNNNIYYVTQANVYAALDIAANKANLLYDNADSPTSIEMQQGQNYVLTVNVSKTGIVNLTATLADWTQLEGEFTRNNAYLTFDFLSTGTEAASNFDIYRAADDYEDYVVDDATVTNDPHYNWSGITNQYSNTGANLTANGSAWKTDWFWDTNKAFYHFRLVGQQTTGTATAITQDGTNASTFAINSGKTSQNATWGAPFKSGSTISYDLTNGFAVNSNSPIISPAIGATNSNIHFTMLNMLAHIKVNILTTTGNDKVTLVDGSNGTKVYLSNIFTTGTVNLGNGLVTTTGSRATSRTEMVAPSDMTMDGSKIKGSYDYYVVPEALVDGSTYVGLYIETPDKNVYYVVQKLSDIVAKTVTNGTSISIGQAQNSKIDRWYPNCTYTYNITLTKTGITKITATLAPYTEISGDTNISIED